MITSAATTETIGDRVRRHCNESGRKAYWVAAQLGMNRNAFGLVLKGERQLSVPEAITLGNIFGVSPETFLPEETPDG